MTNDQELKKRIWKAIISRFIKFSKNRRTSVGSYGLLGPLPLSRVEKIAWADILTSAGCELFPHYLPMEDTESDMFIRDTAIGNIRVPREVANKILVLGDLP